MKSMIVAAAAALVLTSQAFSAGSVTSVQVTLVRTDTSGRGMVYFSQNIGGTPPGCVHPSYVNALAFDANTAGGKIIYAAALSAQARGATMSVIGKGTCSIYGSYVEDVDYALVNE